MQGGHNKTCSKMSYKYQHGIQNQASRLEVHSKVKNKHKHQHQSTNKNQVKRGQMRQLIT